MLIYLQTIETQAEKSKFETLYLAYQQMMYALAFRILHNECDAEDAVHAAFVKLAENMDKISDPMCPKTKSYIVTIVENKAIDIYRAKQRHPHVAYDEETVGLQVEYRGENELARCMAQLPAKYRNVLLLKYSHGYDTKEVASILGISVENAYKLEQRAKAKLEKLCRERGIL